MSVTHSTIPKRKYPLGASNPKWKGFGDISQTYWYSIQKDARKRGHTFLISIEYAWELFCEQQCKCIMTGLDISFRNDSGIRGRKGSASLDRIDSSVGYEPGNIQWVHQDVNLMKNTLPQERFIELCRLIATQSL